MTTAVRAGHPDYRCSGSPTLPCSQSKGRNVIAFRFRLELLHFKVTFAYQIAL